MEEVFKIVREFPYGKLNLAHRGEFVLYKKTRVFGPFYKYRKITDYEIREGEALSSERKRAIKVFSFFMIVSAN